MCGIAGYVNIDNTSASPQDLMLMAKSLAHRGPDDEGFWLEGPVAVCHRRLSIIDPSSAGHQPMVSSDGRYVLSYNGEVYNFKELRRELELAGYDFRSNTDSEVVLYSICHWGEKAITRFNGMFSLACWDRQNNSLLLARDRYGIKPLYYGSSSGKFCFASEQKAIWALPDFRRQVDKEALFEYFTFQNIFTNRTFEKSLNLFPAGHYATVSFTPNNHNISLQQYWDFNFEETQNPPDEQACIEELNRLFRQAVQRQLVTDVELGSYLSGGMDSGSITAIASERLPYIKSFTCGFDLSSASGMELNYDERQQAELMSYAFKTEHYEMVLKAGDMERCMSKLVWHLEEPRVGQSYPNLYASKLASKFVKVVLAGTGGDELFGGYPWRYYRAIGNNTFEEYIDKYYQFWQRLIPNSSLRKVFNPIWDDVGHVWTKDIFQNVFLKRASTLNKPEDYINHSLYFEAKTFLQGLLIVEDKLSMAYGLESRVPFLDNDLVDFAMSCPLRYKLSNLDEVVRLNENDPGNKLSTYYQKNRDGKQVLRKAMSRYLPEEITSNVKQGFSAPDASWFKGDSIDYVKETLLNNNAGIYDFLDKKETQSLLLEHLNGQENRRLLVWSLLYVETYLQQLCERPSF